MKNLLLPLVFAVIAGVASSTAATFVNAKKAQKVMAAHLADSLEKHAHDSTSAADSLEKEHKVAAAAHEAEALPLTPADSIRAAHSEPTTLAAATKGLPNAAEAGHGAPAASAHGAPAPAPAPAHGAPAPANAHAAPAAAAPAADAHADPHAAAPAGHDVVAAPKSGGAKGKVITPRAVDVAKTPAPARAAAPDATEGSLPEGRIAKIFTGMAAKDAAKILEQMNDSDVRTILGRMNDKQAAAILVAFPAQRAAAISGGSSKVAAPPKTDAKADSANAHKPAGDHK